MADTIVTKKGTVLSGELVSLSRGVLLLKTDYAFDPLNLKWNEISLIKTAKRFKLFSRKGFLYIGRLQLDTLNGKAVMSVIADSTLQLNKDEIVEINRFENQKLSDKLALRADIGYTQIKANKSIQMSLGFNAAYTAKRWLLNLDYFSYGAMVDTVSNGRGSLGLGVKYIFPGNWFIVGQGNFFSSTEQNIDLRKTALLGLGNFLIRRDKNLLYINAGGTFNDEKFTTSAEKFKSSEIFGNIHSELYLVRGIDILNELILYQSLSEAGRFRVYFNSDIRLNFVRHFSFGLGGTLNTDSKPPVASNKTDYILNIKLGWKL